MKKPILLTTTALALLLAPAIHPQFSKSGSERFAPSGFLVSAANAQDNSAAECDPATQNCAEAPAAPAPEAEQPAAPQPVEEAPAAPAVEEQPAPAPEAEQPAPAPEAEQPAPAPEAEQPAPAPEAEQPAPAPEAEQSTEQESAPAAETTENAEPEASPAPDGQAVETEAKKPKNKKKKHSEQAEGGKKPKAAKKEAASEGNTGVDSQAVEAPTPSPDAPQPQPIAEETVEEQIKQAEETAPAVISEEITQEQKAELQRAEKKRREKAKDNRAELIGAAAVGAVIGALLPELGGRVVEDEGDRFVVERDGRRFVRRDESALFRYDARDVEYEQLRGGRTREIVYQRDGSQVITVRDPGGYILRRVKVTPNGDRYVLFDARDDEPIRRRGYVEDLPPLRITIPRDEYIITGSRYDRRSLAEIFAAPVVQELPQKYTLREVRESEKLRSFVRRVDIDTVTFASGSAYVSPRQVDYLADIAGGIIDVIEDNPAAVFLVEGHTDAVGDDVYNLTLSDRRAETVARILVEAYGVPAENLVVEGYGEQYLKVDTQGDERANRRVTVRNISPLLETAER